ncbi:hypothetical protein EXT46_06910 [Pseudoalteromonas sp. CO325X]|uniref:hypothetical protein n=1 Tax=Pseudoalteromonas sp. CO325X TaxID=1777262 RepID=UPI0010235DA6|nr:hypothetical protein [Pseudoalteromonas sp. CO325X]RZF83172.1 hypothetical protein EXT46_06910 [Pseudoalteromonas sp. CO325X]
MANKYLFTLTLLFSQVSCAANSTETVQNCVQQTLGFEVVRTDPTNHRFFVVSNTQFTVESLSNLALDQCFDEMSWQDDWSISVFSSAKYAGYKDEKDIIPLHADNKWINAYLAEIDSSGVTLTPVKP